VQAGENVLIERTAARLFVEDLKKAKVIEENGKQIVVLEDGERISKVKLVGTVVQKSVRPDKSYGYLILDNGTGTIRLRLWEEQMPLAEDVREGDLILVIGKIRVFKEEKYVVPEILKVLKDPRWERVHTLEVLKRKAFKRFVRSICAGGEQTNEHTPGI